MFLLRLEADAKEIKLQALRIFFEEKLVLEFIRTLFNNCKQDEDLLLRFSEDLIVTLERLLAFEDYYYLGKIIPLIKDILLLLKPIETISRFINLLSKLASLKYNV